MASTLLFDPSDTLLDLHALDPHFQRLFGRSGVRREWWAELQRLALVDALTENHRDFRRLAAAALAMIAERHRIRLRQSDIDEILDAFARLPPYPDAPESLARLRGAGFRLVGLSNPDSELTETQLRQAGLRQYFDAVLSATDAAQPKPATIPYRSAAERLGVDPSELRVVAGDYADLRGALHSGCAAALLERPGAMIDPDLEKPDIVASDLAALAERLVEVEMGQTFPG